MLKFVRHAIELQGDGVEISEAAVRMVLHNLDSVNRLSQAYEAVLLLQSVLDLVAHRIDGLSESQVSDLKTQYDLVASTLASIVLISSEKVVKVSLLPKFEFVSPSTRSTYFKKLIPTGFYRICRHLCHNS